MSLSRREEFAVRAMQAWIQLLGSKIKSYEIAKE